MKKYQFCPFSKKMMFRVISQFYLEFNEKPIDCKLRKLHDAASLSGGELVFYLGSTLGHSYLHVYTNTSYLSDPDVVPVDLMIDLPVSQLLDMGIVRIVEAA